MRLIDADRFISQIEDQYMEHDITREKYMDLEDRIMQQPTIEPEPQWVLTSEKLPDELAEVNVTWENTEPEPYYDVVKGKFFTGTAVYFRGRWYWYSATCVDYLREYGISPIDEMDDAIKVIAWQPLPKPYRSNT